ncbi:PAS domain S-box protein [Motiliproteus sediminis]|uniref:PAS domain S-box protein n=1 Tax=Motiliproteus sediminis TaxID=1468178 RepID=UPI001AEF52FD|nr:PAS domain S-box protein [Motiliproteus sediminis]
MATVDLLSEFPPLLMALALGVVMFNQAGAVRNSIGNKAVRLLFLGWLLILISFLLAPLDELLGRRSGPLLLWVEILESATITAGLALIAWALYLTGHEIAAARRQFDSIREQTEQHQGQAQHSHLKTREFAHLLNGSDLDNGQHRWEILKFLAEALDVSRVSLWQYQRNPGQMRCLTLYSSRGDEQLEGMVLQRNQYPRYFEALEEELVIDACDARNDPRTQEFRDSYLTPLDIHAMLDVGIYNGSTLSGVLCIEQQGQSRRWESNDITFIHNAAGLLSAAAAFSTSRRNKIALNENEKRFRAIADYTYDWESWIGPDGNLIWTNPAAERLSGYSLSEIYAMPNPLALLSSKHQSTVRQAMSAALAGNSGNGLEFELIRKDGTALWVSMSWQPIFDEEGESLGVRTSIRDISEQVEQREQLRQAMEELRRSSEQLQLQFNHSPMAIIYWDTHGNFIDVNPAAEQMFGYRRDELSGRTIANLIPVTERDRLEQLMNDLRSNRPRLHCVQDNIRKDGQRIIVDWYEIPIQKIDGQLESVVSFGLDITDRVVFERAFNAIFEGTTHALGPGFLQSLVRVMCQTLQVKMGFIAELQAEENPTMRSVASYQRDGSQPEMQYSLAGTPCQDVTETGICIFERGVQQRYPSDRMLHDLGAESYVGVALRNQEQQVIGVVVLMHDRPLEDARLVESIMRVFASRAGAELERIQERRKQMKLEKQLQHSQRMETLGVLAGGIAHDFNNVLQPISGYAELLLEDFPVGCDAHEDLLQIKQGADRAKSLIKQMMAFSRQVDTEMGVVDPRKLIDDTIRFARGSIPNSITLTAECAPQLPLLQANRTQLDQALMNLITNAYHAIGSCGEITLRAEPFEVTDDYTRHNPTLTPGSYVKINVMDDGSGIDSQTISRIFDPFFTTKQPGEGTGLGLSTTLGIIRTHGGTIDVYSEPGRGTCFTLLLPVMGSNETPVSTSQQDSDALPHAELRILVVDDEQHNVDVTSRMLHKLGYGCVGFTSAQSALAAFLETPSQYDAVLTDQTMPDMSGTELIRQLRIRRPDLPALVMTGFSSESAKREWDELRVLEVVSKPFDVPTLARVMQLLETTSAD